MDPARRRAIMDRKEMKMGKRIKQKIAEVFSAPPEPKEGTPPEVVVDVETGQFAAPTDYGVKPVAVEVDRFDPASRACNTCRYGYAPLTEPFHCPRVDATIQPQFPRVGCEYWRKVWR